jgi:hypothetical protein
MGSEHGRRGEIPERGQILRFPCGSRQGSAVFRLLQAYGPKIALSRLEAAAARLKENLT